jgi:hypothetical protein
MDSRAVSASRDHPTSSDFSERLIDGFFRRWFLYLAPVVLLTAVGVDSARGITGEYQSSARLSATTNPYLALPTVRGTDIPFWEPPAAGTARLINEQLQTDAFIDEVAARAGLTEAVSAGLLPRNVIRSRVLASPAGQNNLSVSATWVDPETAFALAEGVTTGYGEYLNGLAVADSLEAVRFWTERRAAAEDAAALAEQALDTYISALPPVGEGQTRSEEQVLELQRLNAELDRALATVREGQSAIDEAQFNANQAALSSARGFFVIDPPRVPLYPEPVRRDQMLAIVGFGVLGVIVALAALVLTTVTDRSVRTRSQLRLASGLPVVATVPRMKQLRRRNKDETASKRAA